MIGRNTLLQQSWLRVLIIGLILFGITDAALFITNNPNLAPTVIVIGASLIPVTFVVFLHDRFQHMEMRLGLLAGVFLVGGVLGVVVASFLEWGTLSNLNLLSMLWVALIEESAKLLVPVFLIFRCKCRHQVDGLLIGAASGMGFATLETMGYSLMALIDANGSVAALDRTLLVRGLLSPAGHAAWTGYICAVIWWEREKGKHHLYFNRAVLTAFAVAVGLHTAWNAVGRITNLTLTAQQAIEYVGLAIVAIISLCLFAWRVIDAEDNLQRTDNEPPET